MSHRIVYPILRGIRPERGLALVRWRLRAWWREVFSRWSRCGVCGGLYNWRRATWWPALLPGRGPGPACCSKRCADAIESAAGGP